MGWHLAVIDHWGTIEQWLDAIPQDQRIKDYLAARGMGIKNIRTKRPNQSTGPNRGLGQAQNTKGSS